LNHQISHEEENKTVEKTSFLKNIHGERAKFWGLHMFAFVVQVHTFN